MTHQLIKTITESFKSNFNTTPIVVFSPARINLIGEHTYYNEGFVFPAAIEQGIVTTVQKSETDTCTAFAYDKNESYSFSLDTITPLENGDWRNYVIGAVSEIQKKGITVPPFNIAFGSNIPECAGLSSSAALENSVVFSLNELFVLGLTKSEMILISQQAAQNFTGVRYGSMDQYAGMFGEKDHAVLLDCKTKEATPVPVELNDYQLLLINTNVKHDLAEAAFTDRRLVCENVCKLFYVPSLRYTNVGDILKIRSRIKEEDYQKALYVVQENSRTLKAVEAVKSNDLERLGALLFESHDGLKNQFYVSCRELDFLVDLAKSNENIIGARMMGEGFGGCTINIVKKSALAEIQENISKLYKDKFNRECSFYNVNLSEGIHVVKV